MLTELWIDLSSPGKLLDVVKHLTIFELSAMAAAGVGSHYLGFLTGRWRRRATQRSPQVGSPEHRFRSIPWLAEGLLCIFARTKDINGLMGDFEEHFIRDCESGMGRRRAVTRYWALVLRSVGPQMLQAAKRVGVLGLIAAALRR